MRKSWIVLIVSALAALAGEALACAKVLRGSAMPGEFSLYVDVAIMGVGGICGAAAYRRRTAKTDRKE